jgi:hypothetical protein
MLTLGLPAARAALPPPFSRDPFTDIERTISQFTPPGLDQGKEFHGFAIDEHHILEVQGRGDHLLFQQLSERLDVFLPDPARYDQHDEIFVIQYPIDSAAHSGDVLRSVLGEYGAFVRRMLFEA